MRKVIVGFLLMAVLAVFLGIAALVLLRATLARSDRLLSRDVTALLGAERLGAASHLRGREARAYLLTGDTRFLERVRAARERFEQQLAAARAEASPEELPLLAEVARRQERTSAAADRAMRARERGVALEEVGRLFETEVLPERQALDAALAALLEAERAHLAATQAEADRSAARALHGLLLGLLGTVLSAVVLGVILVRALAERRRAEAVQLALERERAATLALLDAVLDAAPFGVAFFDRSLRFVRVNRVLADYSGLPAQAHLGRRPTEAALPQGRTVEAFLQRVLDTGLPLLDMELTEPRPDAPGQVRHVLINYFPAHTPTGEVMGVGLVVGDITDRKRAEQELQRTAEFRERLLGIVSHDLRNPLNALTLASHALLQSGQVPERERRYAARIHSSAGRMAQMIAELLDFTRGRLGGGIPVHRVPGDLFALTREAAEEAALAARAEGRLEVEVRGSGEGTWDTGRMGQVVGNLVGNALRYSPPGTPVRVEVDGTDEEVHLSVHNAGEPIPEALVPRLFDPFRRGAEHARRESTREGLGLGLYIVQQIVHAHGGAITVRSTREEGTTFTVRLPRREGRAAGGEATPAQA